MKKTISFIIMMAAGMVAASQTTEDASRDLYYERYASAEKKYSSIISADPSNEDAWYGLVRAFHLQGRSNDAASIYNASEEVKKEPLFQAAFGYFLLSQNKTDSAARFFEEALDKTRHKNVGVLLAVAQAHVENKAGNADYALELIEKAQKRDKKNPALLTLKGDAYLKKNDGSGAYQAYNDALAVNSNYAPAQHKLGLIFLAQKSKDLYLDYFSKAIAADPAYAPSLYRLYAHYFYYDAAKAIEYFNKYMTVSDATIDREYDLADIQYLNREYDKALATAGRIIAALGEKVQPRIFKLSAYSLAGLKDSVQALSYMHRYLATQADSNLLAKDFELMASLSTANGSDSSNYYMAKAIDLEQNPEARFAYFKKLADAAKAAKDYKAQALWLSRYYPGNDKATNVDLFNWGLAYYLSEDFKMADSVFGIYVTKYPEQSFGYYWQARANVALDKDMKDGLAVPYYQKLTEVLQKDTANANYKKWMAEAFGYMAAYEANTQKDYKEAIEYFEKVLEVDPENESARKYIGILEKDVNHTNADSR